MELIYLESPCIVQLWCRVVLSGKSNTYLELPFKAQLCRVVLSDFPKALSRVVKAVRSLMGEGRRHVGWRFL